MKAAFDESTPADAMPFTVYVASKTEGERAAWKWVKNNKPAFEFNAVLPYYTVSKRMGQKSGGFNAPYLLIHIVKSSVKSFTPKYLALP